MIVKRPAEQTDSVSLGEGEITRIDVTCQALARTALKTRRARSAARAAARAVGKALGALGAQ